MKRRVLTSSAAVLAAVALVTGCGGVAQHASDTNSAATTPAADPHNQADVTFAQHMIPHHQQAIDMSDTLLAKPGIDARVVALANQIKSAQSPEIQQMQSWLSAWGTPVMAMPGHDMPGMMTGEEMTALQNAQGAEAAKTYLTQMIAHHQGAITAAQDEIKTGQYPQSIAMAQSIITSQQQEIDTMQNILGAL
jgi:uncharacterized protein (DUF305 family)